MRYKAIKSVAHNFAHSFTSLMNYHVNDYVMEHLARAAAASGEPELRVDLLAGAADPPALLPPNVRESVDWYVQWFPRLLESHGIRGDAVRRAGMRVRFDLPRRTASVMQPGTFRLPFEAVVEIEDDRGITHAGTVRGTW